MVTFASRKRYRAAKQKWLNRFIKLMCFLIAWLLVILQSNYILIQFSTIRKQEETLQRLQDRCPDIKLSRVTVSAHGQVEENGTRTCLYDIDKQIVFHQKITSIPKDNKYLMKKKGA